MQSSAWDNKYAIDNSYSWRWARTPLAMLYRWEKDVNQRTQDQKVNLWWSRELADSGLELQLWALGAVRPSSSSPPPLCHVAEGGCRPPVRILWWYMQCPALKGRSFCVMQWRNSSIRVPRSSPWIYSHTHCCQLLALLIFGLFFAFLPGQLWISSLEPAWS